MLICPGYCWIPDKVKPRLLSHFAKSLWCHIKRFGLHTSKRKINGFFSDIKQRIYRHWCAYFLDYTVVASLQLDTEVKINIQITNKHTKNTFEEEQFFENSLKQVGLKSLNIKIIWKTSRGHTSVLPENFERNMLLLKSILLHGTPFCASLYNKPRYIYIDQPPKHHATQYWKTLTSSITVARRNKVFQTEGFINLTHSCSYDDAAIQATGNTVLYRFLLEQKVLSHFNNSCFIISFETGRLLTDQGTLV